VEPKYLDKVNEARKIINGVRDSLIYMGNSEYGELPDTVCVVLEVALDKALALLDEASLDVEVRD